MPLSDVRIRDRELHPARTIESGANIRDALDLVLQPDVHSVIVTRDGEPIGIVTEGDVIRRVLAEEVPGGSYLRGILASPQAAVEHVRAARAARGDRVDDLMTMPVLTLTPDDTYQRAAAIFAERRIRQIPVAEGGRVLGMLDRRDVVHEVRAQREGAAR